MNDAHLVGAGQGKDVFGGAHGVLCVGIFGARGSVTELLYFTVQSENTLKWRGIFCPIMCADILHGLMRLFV